MHSEARLILGGLTTLAVATAVLVVVPYLTVRDTPPVAGLKPYTSTELRGRTQYIQHGCMYCHSPQPRPKAFAPDSQRAWGRATVAGDYAYDDPPLLGTMRTGPDLMNIGVRQPSDQWHLGHLYQPRAYAPGSVMPAYPFLFEVRDEAEAGETVVVLPPDFAPEGKVVVARPEALDLVSYLKSLNRSYPAVDTASVK